MPRSKPAFLDFRSVPSCCADHALEALAKSLSGEDGDTHDIWKPHHSVLIARLIELFTQRGLLQIQKVNDELHSWLTTSHYIKHGHAPALKPDGASLRWTDAEMELVKVYLESLPPGTFTFEDWGLLVDYLVNRYMPTETLQSEASWLAVRSTIMGKVQAALDGTTPSHHEADRILAAMPLSVEAANATFKFPPKFKAIMSYARARCCDQVVGIAEKTRHRLKSVIMAHQALVLAGDPSGTSQSLQTKLFDEFAALNRDWRRIAVTEAGENANQGLIASLPVNSKVKRMERYAGACPFCRSIDGRVMTVVDPDKPNRDGDTEVWVGKTNVGRSASPNRKTDTGMVERGANERWWIPAGTVHPHCRGMWSIAPGPRPEQDQVFGAWLQDLLNPPVKEQA